jgi:ABC-2 type transport system ATP-binding protein
VSRTAADHNSIIAVDRLEKTYRGGSFLRRGDIHALRGVSLHAEAGQVFGLLGPNGAGKTTLIKILLGVIRSTGGSASLFGLPAGCTAARARVGYLPESLRVDRHHTARSALRFYGKLSRLDSPTIARRSDELLQIVGLAGRDRESVKRFSKGMLQRLGLAQALMHDPDLLILDEPTDGLDPVGRSEVRRVLERLRDAGKTIFLNSHILHEVELVCTHLAIMAGGHVLAAGPIADLGGPASGSAEQIAVELEFELPRREPLSGDESATEMRAELPLDLLAPAHTDSLVWLGDPVVIADSCSRYQCRFVCDQRAALDEIVDRIRGANGSLIRLLPHRHSLEETFMRLVQAQDQVAQEQVTVL